MHEDVSKLTWLALHLISAACLVFLFNSISNSFPGKGFLFQVPVCVWGLSTATIIRQCVGGPMCLGHQEMERVWVWKCDHWLRSSWTSW